MLIHRLSNPLLYLCCVCGTIAFSVLVIGLKPEYLYVYLPLLIVIGIGAAFRLETLVKALWMFLFERPRREQQTHRRVESA